MKTAFSYSLPIIILKEKKSFVAYTPALDLSSAGRTPADARRMLVQAAKEFFEELMVAGTLDSVLNELGWTKEKKTRLPPKVVSQSKMKVTVPI